jgi:hypothetical protein
VDGVGRGIDGSGAMELRGADGLALLLGHLEPTNPERAHVELVDLQGTHL